jgi:hypothetical protein
MKTVMVSIISAVVAFLLGISSQAVTATKDITALQKDITFVNKRIDSIEGRMDRIIQLLETVVKENKK